MSRDEFGGGDLSYYYTFENKIHGPYPGYQALQWFQAGYFKDDLQVRITDNGERIGDLFTWNTSIGTLRAHFGGTIPTHINQIKMRGYKTEKDAEKTLPTLGNRLSESSQNQGTTGKKSVFGRLTMTSNSSNSSHSNGKEGKHYLPFYDGSNGTGKTKLEVVVAIELGSVLSGSYQSLSKDNRSKLYAKLQENDLPQKCKFCGVQFDQAKHYLEHVLCRDHITKSIVKYDLEFTFENDYVPLKELISEVRESKSSTWPTSSAHSTRSRHETRSDCEQQ